MTESTFNDAETAAFEASIAHLDDLGKDVARVLDTLGWTSTPERLNAAIERLDPNRVPTQVVERIEASCLRTHQDLGSGSAALALWNRVRGHAGLNLLTKADLVNRTIAMYEADAQRAADRGDAIKAERYTALAEQVRAENADLLART